MDAFIQVPPGITNVPRWEEDCRKIHARARDLVDGKIGVIEAAEALHILVFWTKAQQDQDFAPFLRLWEDLIGLPIGSARILGQTRARARGCEDPCH